MEEQEEASPEATEESATAGVSDTPSKNKKDSGTEAAKNTEPEKAVSMKSSHCPLIYTNMLPNGNTCTSNGRVDVILLDPECML